MFLNSLSSSETIKFLHDSANGGKNEDAVVRIPKVLACTFSKTFDLAFEKAWAREVCIEGYEMDKWDLFDITHPQNDITDPLEYKFPHTSFRRLLGVFVDWLYTSNIVERVGEDLFHWELWYFGAILAAPRFQNDVLRNFCIVNTSNRAETTFEGSYPFQIGLSTNLSATDISWCLDTLKWILDARSAAPELNDYWKQTTKWMDFLLDLAGCAGVGDPFINSLLYGHEAVSSQIMKAIDARARPG